MLAEERRERIRRELELRGRVEVTRFAEAWGYSQMTIRRDLEVLVHAGLARRVRGGAVAVDEQIRQPGTSDRGTLGFIIPEATHEFREMVRGAGTLARSEGFRLIVGASGNSRSAELRHITRMHGSAVDAILLAPADDAGGEGDIDRWRGLCSAPTPLVLVDGLSGMASAGLQVDVVEADRPLAMRMAVQHLAARGHGSVGLVVRDGRSSDGMLAGYRDVVGGLGLDGRAPVLRLPRVRGSAGGAADERAFVERCLASGTRAIVVAPDEDAIELIEAIEHLGLRVPRDFSIVAIGDSVSALSSVPLTSVATPAWALGHQAMETALLRLQSPAPLPPRRVTLFPSLTERESTAGGAAPRPIRSEQVPAA